MWANDAERLRAIAAAKLKAEPLQWWWSKHYNRPLKDPLLQEYTNEELQVEYFMHLIEADPQAAYPRHNGEIQFRTGDAIIDKWEEQLAKNEDADINWDEGVDADLLADIKRYSQRVASKYGIGAPAQSAKSEVASASASASASALDLSDLSGFDDVY